jgi:hypothetical protein
MSEQYWKDRADALEHRVRAAEGHAESANDGMLKEKRRADALERALRQIRMRRSAEAHQIAIDALTQQAPDQPAQNSGRIDPYTLEWAAHEAEKTQITGQTTSRFVEGRNRAAEDIAAAIRNLRPDQPAHHSLEPLQHQPLSEEARERGQEALRRLAGKDQPADAGEPDEPELTINKQPRSCCARTREECARIVEKEAVDYDHLSDGDVTDDEAKLYGDRAEFGYKLAAAIRRTGGTP